MPEDSAFVGNPIDPRIYGEAKRIFEETIALPEEERAAYLDRCCGKGSDLHQEVISLLEHHNRADSFFDERAGRDPMIGRKISSYQVLRRIGVGGMGAVYLAERADEQFRKLVALKTVRPGIIDEQILRRFRNERQTLAVLDHPNIVKLLDAGATEEGIPYLVMEYIEGQTIEAYCAANKLPVRERVELFRVILGAIHYAHQNLVVHRDLKPANILVTPAGVPKLLDFGIAKLLRAEYAIHMGLTRTALQPMTPDFASPEQIQGQPITTATDIYSLGVILYRLLAGQHPYELKTYAPLELEHAICETDPEKPSKLAVQSETWSRIEGRSLRGDLDTIVLMAIRKEPQRRYPSVLHFSEDLRRYLEGWPVSARTAGVPYRVSKFVSRHKATCAVSLILGLGLVLSGAAALREKRAADRRFADLRNFANFVLNDLDAKLRDGTTPARQLLAEKSLAFLDGLAEERPDAALQSDLINGYIKNGDLRGNLYGSNLGEMAIAEADFRKALRFAEQLEQDQQGLMLAHRKLGEFLAGAGRAGEAIPHYREALEAGNRIAAGQSTSLDLLKDRFTLWTDIASAQVLVFDFEEAVESYQHAFETAHSFPVSYSSRESAIALSQEQAAYWRARSGSATGAEQTILEAIATYQKALAANPRSTRRRNLAKAYKNLADIQNRAGKRAEALANIRESIRATGLLRGEDPSNAQYQIDFQQALLAQIEILTAAGFSDDAKSETKRALEVMKPLAERSDSPYQHAVDYAELLATTPFSDLRDDAAALRYAQKALSASHELDPEVWHVVALAWERNGDYQRAVEADQKALTLLPAPKNAQRPPEFRTLLESELARLSAKRAGISSR